MISRTKPKQTKLFSWTQLYCLGPLLDAVNLPGILNQVEKLTALKEHKMKPTCLLSWTHVDLPGTLLDAVDLSGIQNFLIAQNQEKNYPHAIPQNLIV